MDTVLDVDVGGIPCQHVPPGVELGSWLEGGGEGGPDVGDARAVVVVKVPEDEASSIEENTCGVESEDLVTVLQLQGVEGLQDQEHHHHAVHCLKHSDEH